MKGLFNRVFYTPKHAKHTDKSIQRLVFPSVVGIMLCMICLAGATWAWFSASIQLPTQKMTAAYYEVHVASVKLEETEIDSTADGRYVLEAGKSYTIVLTADGTVKECSGYCLIENEDETVKYYTQTLAPDSAITVALTPAKDGNYTFTGVWGSIPSTVTDILNDTNGGEEGVKENSNNTLSADSTSETKPDNSTETTGSDTTDTTDVTDATDVVDTTDVADTTDVTDVTDTPDVTDEPQDVTAPEETIYKVKKGDTLYRIGMEYGASVKELAEYNSIEDPNYITVGQIIKIPA